MSNKPIRFPRTVIIGGRLWHVNTDSETNGSSSHCRQQKIIIGTRYGREDAYENFLHEIIETVLVERMHRYNKPYTVADNGSYVFVFNHAEFEEAIKDIYLALRDFLK